MVQLSNSLKVVSSALRKMLNILHEHSLVFQIVQLCNALVVRTQSKNEAIIDYLYDKVRLCSELYLSFEKTKPQLLEGFYSQSMVTYLLSKYHTETDGMFDDILTYERLNKMCTTL